MRDLVTSGLGEPAWYLAQCKPGQEHIASAQIALRGLAEVFLPREERRRRWRGRWQSLLVPVFPGYLFVAPDKERPDWPAIRTTRGLRRIVAFGAEGPARVPAGIVPALRVGCGPDGVMQRSVNLKPGAHVRILDGPFADLVARIETVASDGRIELLLDLMSRHVRVLTLQKDVGWVAPT